ncbi:hypothetical protein Y032_0825g2549 [Ancylostoma ceylanicum]|uniref:PX domain-containing protein n=1 Tax=Ancylostoma ceylanicum TaxID=53326 RepID=A0A016WBW8_9BILA|nr:hypothetical protein Y032_0825g2549 [Ancylostoma ceylanicum]
MDAATARPLQGYWEIRNLPNNPHRPVATCRILVQKETVRTVRQLNEEIDHLPAEDVLSHITYSKWAAPVVVKKSNGTLRLLYRFEWCIGVTPTSVTHARRRLLEARYGMAQLVSDCATLCEIQKEFGMTGVFKVDVLRNWLMKHNTTEFLYKQALDNFTRSCAGWCVATYVLGIGDRHNDNILVTTAGHVFHIDFGKYMGDWQTAAGFRRDRVPFVFTDEMYHVINGGNQQKESYQTFIDYCCRAFNYIRRNYIILANLLKIMACSDISGMNVESLNFVEKNLMLELSETDAVIQFTQLINHSLKSAFPRINFFFHTLAQVMTSTAANSARNNDTVLSFVPQLYTQETDGKIKRVRVISFEKRFLPSKVYLYKVEVIRVSETLSTYVYRSFNEFNELYIKLRRRFPTVAFLALSPGTKMRSNVREVAQRRMVDVESFLRYLFTLSPEVCHVSY